MSIAVTTVRGQGSENGDALSTVPHGTVKYFPVGELDLKSGGFLPQETLAYETWGTLNAIDPAVLGDRGCYQVESYLDHHGTKLARRFDANSHTAITEALISHDVSGGRETLQEALAMAAAEFSIAAVASDRLSLPAQSHELADALPDDVAVHLIEAPIGHDRFLTEIPQLQQQLGSDFYNLGSSPAAAGSR